MESSLEVPAHVLEYLREKPTLTLATASLTGIPRAATLTYANDGLALYVWLQPGGKTLRHVEENPVVSFAIDEYSEDWRATQGVQGSGQAQLVDDAAERERTAGLFRDKFLAAADEITAELRFVRITPTELQFIGEGTTSAIEYPTDVVYSVFRDFPQEELAAIEGRLETIEVKPGTVIVRQGAPADRFFIIADGEVEVLREEELETRVVGRLGRGQFFGEMAILRDMRRSATVQAVTQTTLFAMDRDAFRSVVAQSLGTTDTFDEIIRERMYR